MRVIAHAEAEITARQAHAAVVAATDEPAGSHHDGVKPFTCWPVMDDPGDSNGIVLRAAWLPSGPTPAGLLRTDGMWRFGRLGARVRSVEVISRTYQQMAEAPAPRRVRFQFVSPTRFSRSGTPYPLPEPRLVLEGLARRWNEFAGPWNLEQDDVIRCWRGVEIVGFDLRSESLLMDVRRSQGALPSRELEGLGVVGFLDLAPPDRQTAQVLGALSQFAQFAGVGHLTTQGFGACTTSAVSGKREAAGSAA